MDDTSRINRLLVRRATFIITDKLIFPLIICNRRLLQREVCALAFARYSAIVDIMSLY